MTDLLATTTSTATAHSWQLPAGAVVRGTLVVLPGRGEHGGIYERFGRRLAADAYIVHALDLAPDADSGTVARALRGALGPEPAEPIVLIGADTGALHALRAAVGPGLAVQGLVLAGTAPTTGAVLDAGPDWHTELDARTACPVHRRRLTDDPRFARRALETAVSEALRTVGRTVVPDLPVLVLHGDADAVTPASGARDLAARLPSATLGIIHGGLHDILNDAAHRTAAATIVQWLERLRGGPELSPILTIESTSA